MTKRVYLNANISPAVAHFERCATLKCMHYRHISGAWKSTPHGDAGLLLLIGPVEWLDLWPVSSGSEGQRQSSREISVFDNVA